jgi:hypothetical protein
MKPAERADGANPCAFGTYGMFPAYAGTTP